MDPQDGSKSMGTDTKKYLASFIKDLRTKADTKTPVSQESAGASTVKASPVLFSGSLSQSIPGDKSSDPSLNSNASRIVLSEKEREMLKMFNKLK